MNGSGVERAVSTVNELQDIRNKKKKKKEERKKIFPLRAKQN